MDKQQLQNELDQLKNAAAHALSYAKKKQVSDAEVFMSRQQGLSVSTRQAELENVEFNKDGALGITVYLNGCKGTASTSDLSTSAIEKSVDAAMSIAALTQEDVCHGLADANLLAQKDLDLDLCHPQDISPQELESIANECEQAAMDSGIYMSDGASANAHFGLKVYGNTRDFLKGYMSSRYSFSTVSIAQDEASMQRSYDYSMSRQFSSLHDPKLIGRNSAEKAKARLNARKIDTQTLPVIFHRDVATSLIGSFVGAISGGSLYRKSSFLLDKLQQQIFPSWFEIQEKPHIKQGFSSAPYDAEGVITKDCTIVDQGILQTYLLTSYSARRLNMQTTGHAGGIYNWFVKDTGVSHQELLKQMGTGILVTELMGQGVNLVTGDYSRGAAGFFVENGQIQYPIDEFTIAGRLQDMFLNMQGIDNEPDPRSSLQTGAILLEEMKIAGSN